jgi:excisionase family DNA binding protein
MKQPPSADIPPSGDRLVSVAEARARLDASHTKVMELLASGELPSVKLGRRRLILESRLVEFIASLEATPAAE